MRRETTDAIQYIRDLYAQEDLVLASVHRQLEPQKVRIQLGAEEAKFLQLLIHLASVKTIVEVGTLGGYSTLWLARAIKQVQGHVYTLELSTEHAELAQSTFDASEVNKHITLIQGDAVITLKKLEEKGPFDMMFIDADKGSYTHYLDWAEHHIKKGGLIVADNTLLFGSVYQNKPPKEVSKRSWDVMRAFNERLSDEEKFETIMLPTVSGLSIAIKRF